MHITPTILSIPPYLSTAWKNISSLQTVKEGSTFRLIISLRDKTRVEIPNLDEESVKKIFDAHTYYCGKENNLSPLNSPFSLSLPFPSENNGLIDSLGPSMQHNEEQANLPPLAPDILKKIGMVARAFGLEDLSLLPEPKPGCRCVYCQLLQSMKNEVDELEISEEDLHFKNWEIQQTNEKLYLVTNPLDTNEHYHVYLGDPLGCTCGKKNCEHIREVLKS
jgi:hypothetical protein